MNKEHLAKLKEEKEAKMGNLGGIKRRCPSIQG